MSAEDRFPSYRAPQADRQVLCVPPWATISEQLTSARDHLNASKVEILGTPLPDLARAARDALVAQAKVYIATYTSVSEVATETGPLILTGHQPALAHPGVWLKNFAAAQLAKELGGTAINLVIDSDLCRAASVRVPTGSIDTPRAEEVAFDQPQPEVPYEERTVADREVWNSFGDRVTRALSPLLDEPLIANWWSGVTSAAEENPLLGLSIAQSRHRLEKSWGLHNLEIPQSQVCQTATFQQFVLHLLTSADRLRSVYNESLAEYRASHRLRSPAQPLPDLTEIDDWIETPLWIWTTQHPTRRALFVQSSAKGLLLSDQAGWQDVLPLPEDGCFDAAIERMKKWHAQGVKIRSRALITTLYARLLLADTFIHGIGGAKYDQVTNLICQRLFGVELPPFVTLTTTLRLPIDHPQIAASQASELRQTLRRLRYHPESYLHQLELDPESHAQVDALLAQKKRWVQTPKTSANAAQRHSQIESANEGLQHWLQPQRAKLEKKLALTIAQTRTNQILESREYPFCLFPQQLLQDFLLDFSSSIL